MPQEDRHFGRKKKEKKKKKRNLSDKCSFLPEKKQKQKQHNFLVDFKNHKLSRRERSRAVGIFVIKKKKLSDPEDD